MMYWTDNASTGTKLPTWELASENMSDFVHCPSNVVVCPYVCTDTLFTLLTFPFAAHPLSQ